VLHQWRHQRQHGISDTKSPKARLLECRSTLAAQANLTRQTRMADQVLPRHSVHGLGPVASARGLKQAAGRLGLAGEGTVGAAALCRQLGSACRLGIQSADSAHSTHSSCRAFGSACTRATLRCPRWTCLKLCPPALHALAWLGLKQIGVHRLFCLFCRLGWSGPGSSAPTGSWNSGPGRREGGSVRGLVAGSSREGQGKGSATISCQGAMQSITKSIQRYA
jgi:hypothetical protein